MKAGNVRGYLKMNADDGILVQIYVHFLSKDEVRNFVECQLVGISARFLLVRTHQRAKDTFAGSKHPQNLCTFS